MALLLCCFNQENAVKEKRCRKKCLAFCFGMFVNHICTSLIINLKKCIVNGIGIDILVITYPSLACNSTEKQKGEQPLWQIPPITRIEIATDT